jgi:6-pyruvoyltetrahydropterin/6-carboxytetrahydropterin synthase
MLASRRHEFSYGHRVTGHEGKCRRLHGHNALVEFTVWAKRVDDIGRVVDFGVIRDRLCTWLEENWDHRFLAWDKDPESMKLKELDHTVVLAPFNPTAENMAEYLVEEVGKRLFPEEDLKLVRCTFWETSKCYATYSLAGWLV